MNYGSQLQLHVYYSLISTYRTPLPDQISSKIGWAPSEDGFLPVSNKMKDILRNTLVSSGVGIDLNCTRMQKIVQLTVLLTFRCLELQ